ncbi:MAG: hypothetical protein JJU36_12185 [Phycisphaeraceae bacterium]|nr:hypothetical protein [Phycisphaeraceae bacterium]
MTPNDTDNHADIDQVIDLNEVFNARSDEVVCEYDAEIKGPDDLELVAPDSRPGNDHLRRLAKHHRAPQQWYDDDDDPFGP